MSHIIGLNVSSQVECIPWSHGLASWLSHWGLNNESRLEYLFRPRDQRSSTDCRVFPAELLHRPSLFFWRNIFFLFFFAIDFTYHVKLWLWSSRLALLHDALLQLFQVIRFYVDDDGENGQDHQGNCSNQFEKATDFRHFSKVNNCRVGALFLSLRWHNWIHTHTHVCQM